MGVALTRAPQHGSRHATKAVCFTSDDIKAVAHSLDAITNVHFHARILEPYSHSFKEPFGHLWYIAINLCYVDLLHV